MMSYRWPNKDPDELLDYSMDWSRWLGSPTNTLSVVTWYVDNANGVKTELSSGSTINGITNSSQSQTGTVAIINLSGGDNNKEYKFYCQIQDGQGNIAERVVKLRVREQ